MADNIHSTQLGAARGRLKSVGTPSDNHEEIDLPPVSEAFLTSTDVAAVFADIAKFGAGIQLMRNRTANNQPASNDLSAAHQSLADGTAVRVQVRYQWQGRQWIDTFENRGERIRLVRIAHPA